jgi:uncharacterized protein (TIRG00374 family)
MKIIKQILSVLLKGFISIFLLWYLFRQVDKQKLLETVIHADKLLLTAAFCLFSFTYTVCLFRWKMLLDAIKIDIPLRRVIASFSGGIFFNQILPSSIGGDLVRSVDLASHTKKAKEVVATVFLDRLSGYIGLVVMSLLSLACGWKLIHDKTVLYVVLAISGLLGLILLVLFNKYTFSKVNSLLRSPKSGKFREAITGIHQQIHVFRDKKSTAIKNILYSLGVQILGATSFYVIARSVGVDIKMIYFFIFVPIMGVVTLLPISIGGLGVRENIAAYLFPLVGVPKDLAIAMSLLNFSFILICAVTGGLIYYVYTVRHRRLQSSQSSAAGR